MNRFHVSAVLMGAGLLLSGCGSNNGNPASSPQSSAATTTQAAVQQAFANVSCSSTTSLNTALPVSVNGVMQAPASATAIPDSASTGGTYGGLLSSC